jgi:hypothetical protein
VADEKRQLILDLLARNKMRKDTTEAADDLDKLGRSAEEADKKTSGLGDSSSKATQKTDKLGHSAEETCGKISKLDEEAANLEKEIGTLAKSFADAGDAGERLDISKAIRRTQTQLRSVNKSKSILEDLLPDEGEVKKETKKVTKNVESDFLESFASIGKLGGPAMFAGIAVAAPELGAIISGAIIGGAGIGGVVGGFVLAAQDPRIKTAFGALKKDIGTELKGAAEPFLPVTMNAIKQIGDAVERINFKGIFADASKYAGPIINGITTVIDELGRGIEALVHNAGPAVSEIGDGIGQIGVAIGNGLQELSHNGKAGADALTDLFSVITTGITVTFELVDGLTKIYEFGKKIGDSGIVQAFKEINGIAGPLDLINAFKGLNDAIGPTTSRIKNVGSASDVAAASTSSLARAQTDSEKAALGQRDALSALAKELKAQTDPAFAVLDATDQVRDAQKEAAAAVRKYGSNSEEARAATRKLAEAAIGLQGDVGALGGSFNGTLTPSMRSTLKAAGLTKGQIHQVEEELKRAKHAADAYDGTYRATVVTTYVTKSYQVGGSDYNREANRGAFSGKRAAGGPIVRGVPYLVGENGPEIVVPDASGRVLNASGSRGLMVQGAMSGSSNRGAGSGPVNATLTVSGAADQAVATLINYLARKNMIHVTVG